MVVLSPEATLDLLHSVRAFLLYNKPANKFATLFILWKCSAPLPTCAPVLLCSESKQQSSQGIFDTAEHAA